MANAPITIRRLGRAAYVETVERMRNFTAARDADSPDEIWLLEHESVYTLGVRGRNRLLQPPNDVPVVVTDRGGDVTYHGPGQPIVYVLVDLTRRGLGIHALVQALEQAAIDVLADLGIEGTRRKSAPGVYVADRKIASLGLRVRAGRSYHGLALNARMDLTPFHAIDPCGYPGLRMTQLAEWQPDIDANAAGEHLLRQVLVRLGYTDAVIPAKKAKHVTNRFDARR